MDSTQRRNDANVDIVKVKKKYTKTQGEHWEHALSTAQFVPAQQGSQPTQGKAAPRADIQLPRRLSAGHHRLPHQGPLRRPQRRSPRRSLETGQQPPHAVRPADGLPHFAVRVEARNGLPTLRVACFFSGVERKASIAEFLKEWCTAEGFGLAFYEVDTLVG